MPQSQTMTLDEKLVTLSRKSNERKSRRRLSYKRRLEFIRSRDRIWT